MIRRNSTTKYLLGFCSGLRLHRTLKLSSLAQLSIIKGRRDHRLPLDALGVSDGSQPVTRGLRIRQVWLSVPDLSCMWNFVYSTCLIAKVSSIGRSVSHFNPCWRDASEHDEVARLSEGLVSISP
ncbi:unnamed protein product [Phytophthora fragariaefolia]|uniref:Unnamed protein product n=1 Tax=Phytophthora fragariaefolia TaxID=1490495 RepID=A0A9W6XJK7_9STRA|nr:unnamed protein product [Phytophthora fragariaefolia]